jgi:hypothetical protein
MDIAAVVGAVPTASGVYRLWAPTAADTLTYIGQTANLKDRLYTHRRERDDDLRVSFAQLAEAELRAVRLEVETNSLAHMCWPVSKPHATSSEAVGTVSAPNRRGKLATKSQREVLNTSDNYLSCKK